MLHTVFALVVSKNPGSKKFFITCSLDKRKNHKECMSECYGPIPIKRSILLCGYLNVSPSIETEQLSIYRGK